jgi:16S rRNA G966 N2-methylase RsmD
MTSQNSDPDHQLLAILSTEIEKDGGTSLTTLIKDYYVERPKQIDSLLVKTVGSKQMLKFFEKHNSIFSVDRASKAHVVKLLSNEHSCCDQAVVNTKTADHTLNTREVSRCREALQDKVLYVLRKRNVQISRRQRSNDTHHVSCEWLLRQCKIPTHLYLRSVGFYKSIYVSCHDVELMGSKEWESRVIPVFQTAIKEWVMFSPEGKIFLDDAETVDDDSTVSVESLANKLLAFVEKDGATQISLSLLLHRAPELKRLLGGRDLLQLASTHVTCFKGMHITVDDKREVFLQSTKKARVGRMDVDEVGLFSVASSRWSTAMANILAKQCHVALNIHPKDIVALDLTASVGGVTLGLAKVFERVIAIEIDEHRANLCRQNMQRQSVSDIVDVRNMDAMDAIPTLPTHSVVFLDPPWGGHSYKREKPPLRMGSWSFADVLVQVGRDLAPCVVGVRLPITCQVGSLLDMLIESDLPFEILKNKKLGPQLFVVLHFPEHRGNAVSHRDGTRQDQ